MKLAGRLLITGAAGMLGQDVAATGRNAGLDVVALPRAELDITDAAVVNARIEDERPDVVFNCAAWTDVDGAEADPDGALAVNATGVANVAAAAQAIGAWTVHISSDYVFDGSKREPYVESDPVAPLSAYGRSKLAGEEAVAEAAPGIHTIVRSSWLFGPGGPCFPATILRLAAEREQLAVVDDQVGCPTFTRHLAAALVEMAAGTRLPGIVHVAAAGPCSWFEFATEIVAKAGLDCEVRPVPTIDVPRPARRPPYSALASERPGAPQLPHWREGLEEFMAVRV